MKKEKIKLEEHIKEVESTLSDNAAEVADMLENYEGGDSYICDAITEQADSMVDVYNSDLLEWAKHHLGDIEEANAEFGTPEDIIKQIQQAQYKAYSDELYEGLEEGGRFFALKVAAREVDEVTPEQLEELEDLEIDNNDRISDLIEKVNDVLIADE